MKQLGYFFIINALIILGVFYNCYYLFEVKKQEKKQIYVSQINKELILNKNFFNNDLATLEKTKEKYYKSEFNYQKASEEIYDTSSFETEFNKQESGYLPSNIKVQKPNWQHWLNCFGSQNLSTSDEICKI
jgi:hypothetical protein